MPNERFSIGQDESGNEIFQEAESNSWSETVFPENTQQPYDMLSRLRDEAEQDNGVDLSEYDEYREELEDDDTNNLSE